MEEKEEPRQSASSSPYQSLGDRPEMELDLWEGQFNLSSLQGLEGLTEEEYEDYSRGSTCWGEDSVVTMGTVQQLQEEVGQLQEERSTDENRYQSVKQDNSELVQKIFILEELLRDSELSHIQTQKEKGIKIKELESKLNLVRKKNEDFAARIEYLEEENNSLLLKSEGLNKSISNLITENQELCLKISNYEIENADEKQDLQDNRLYFLDEDKGLYERSRLEQSETDSGCHVQDSEDMVSDLQGRLAEMEAEIRVLREQQSCVVHTNNEERCETLTEKSLAEEIEDITIKEQKSKEDEIIELKDTLASQKEVNSQLQSYIDAVILNIMEKNPELLEVSKKPEDCHH